MSKKRRIQAPEPLPIRTKEQLPTASLLLLREVGLQGNVNLHRSLTEAYLQSVCLERSFDVHDTASTSGMAMSYMQRRSPVLEVIVHKQLLFVLVNSGLCSVFDTGATPERRLPYLNAGEHDIIRSILFNPCDESVLAVSCHTTDESFPSQLHCKSVPADRRSFSKGALYCTAGKPICDSVAHPGFLEFDDSTHRALVFNSVGMQYKVYDLAKPNYTLLYIIPATGITEVKLSSSYLVVVREPCSRRTQPVTAQRLANKAPVQQLGSEAGHGHCSDAEPLAEPKDSDSSLTGDSAEANVLPFGANVLPFQVMSAVNGQLLAKHQLPVQPGQAYFEVLELFDRHLLLKQPMRPFMIFDVLSFAITGSSTHESLSQVSSFVFLQQRHLFMTVSYHTLTTWNFKAELVASFEDHNLWYPGNLDDPLMYLTADWVISYCRPRNTPTSLPAVNAVGAIHISNVWTGKLVAKIQANQTAEEDADMRELLLSPGCGAGLLATEQNTRKALTDVTFVLYDEMTNTIYTGNQAGMVHHWAPG